jgi:hypothetical protein
MVAEVFGACAGGAALTAWALHLGADALVIGLLGALPLAAQVLQLPGAWLTQRFGYRRVAVIAIGGSRLVWLPLALVPVLGLSTGQALPLFLAVVTLAAVLGVVGNNAWTAWIGDLIPRTFRGRFFGRRTLFLSMAGTIATLTVGLVLDAVTVDGRTGQALAALVATGCVAGAASIGLLLRHADPSAGERAASVARPAIEPLLADASVRPFLAYLFAWNAAVALSASFFSFHMLANLQTGFLVAAVHGIVVGAMRVATAPVWGRAVDRLGARPVLEVCSLGIAVVPALWLFATPERLWPIALEAIASGALWSGHGIAVMDLTLGLAPRPSRPFRLAVFAATGGVSFGATSVAAGFVARQLPGTFTMLGASWTNLHVLFALSSIGRASAALLARRIDEPGARRARDVLGAAATLLMGAAPPGHRRLSVRGARGAKP